MSDEDAVRFFVESGTMNAGGETFEVSSANVTVSDSLSGERLTPVDGPPVSVEPEEYTGSLSVSFDTQTVVCPACNSAVGVPSSPFLDAFTREPYPCVECGYPLL